MQWKTKLLCGAVCLAQAACLCLPAWAAQGQITPETTMGEIRQNASVAAAGVYTFDRGDDGIPALKPWLETMTLAEYVGTPQAQDCADSLNLVVQNYNAGVQVTHKIYTDEEIAATPAKAAVELYYFPAKEANAKYALVIGGNSMMNSGVLLEGEASAARLHEMGYAVFVLRYRIWMDMGNNAPLEDLAQAVRYITDRADQFSVQTDNYALLSYSSGGQIAGVFANAKRGYAKYGVAKPGVLLMAYPIVNLTVMKPIYHTLYDTESLSWRYYWTDLKDAVDSDYPPVYFWRGDNDVQLGSASMPGQHDDFEKALQANNVPYKRVDYQNAPHAIATGNGTEAEGWLTDAVAFWEAYTN